MFPQRLQIQNARLNAEMRTLKGTGASKQAQAGRVALSTISMDAATEEKKRLAGYRNHGRHLAALSELWIKESSLRWPYPQCLQSLGPWHPERYASNSAWEDGIVAELYSFLPESCHELIEHSALFSKMVCSDLFN